MMSIDLNEISVEGDRWPQFAKDFLKEIGFHIESKPNSFADCPGDFCAVEQMSGKLNNHPFRWLVSCKHKAATRTAVKESEEIDLLERILHAKADGFIGFYSTPISPAFGHYLSELKTEGRIKDYRVFDSKFLEGYLTTPAFGGLVSRYFPNYSTARRPIHLVQDEYLPIPCDCCNKDLLANPYAEDNKGVVIRLRKRSNTSDEQDMIADIYFACKGVCDEQLQERYCNGTALSAASWANLSDLIMSPVYLERIIFLIDQLGKEGVEFSPQALEKEKYLLRALAQRTLREPSEAEKARVKKMMFNEGS